MNGLISTHVKGDRLQEYAAKLIDDGFTIRVAKDVDVHGKPIPQPWLVYEKDGNVGMVQRELLDSYRHTMPVPATIEDGSAIHMFDGGGLQIEHARKTARPENRGKYNGNKLFKNAGLGRVGGNYVIVEKDPARVVPVKVTWQEIREYETVVEIELEPGLLTSRGGQNVVRERVNAALDELPEEQVDEALSETFDGPFRRIEKIVPIWDAVEVPGT